MKKGRFLLAIWALMVPLCACGSAGVDSTAPTHPETSAAVGTQVAPSEVLLEQPNAATEMATKSTLEIASSDSQPNPSAPEGEATHMQLKIADAALGVEWENNESVEALKALCADEPLVIPMSMYGGFEQVGPIGTSLPRDDVQTTTKAGDIVLYAGNQIVIFYGSNTWAYTRLGRITDSAGLEALLGNGDVTVTICMES